MATDVLIVLLKRVGVRRREMSYPRCSTAGKVGAQLAVGDQLEVDLVLEGPGPLAQPLPATASLT